MAVDLGAIRAAMADQIKDYVDREINVYGGYVPSTPSPPCIIIKPAEDYIVIEAPTYNRPLCEIHLEIWLLTIPGMGTDGQRLADEFLSIGTGQTNSVYDALSSDPTLGGVADTGVFVTALRSRGRLQLDPTDMQTLFDWASIDVAIHQRG
jgi:hypothetical protein